MLCAVVQYTGWYTGTVTPSIVSIVVNHARASPAPNAVLVMTVQCRCLEVKSLPSKIQSASLAVWVDTVLASVQ